MSGFPYQAPSRGEINDNTSLRILMIVHSEFERDARVRRYAESLAANGHEVDVVALGDPAAAHSRQVDGLRLIEMPIKRRRSHPLRTALEWIVFTLLAAWKALRLSRKQGYDVVHVHNMPNFLVFSALPARLYGAKVILDIHDLVPEVFESKFGRTPKHPILRILRVEERLSCRFADAVIYATDIFRDIARARGSSGTEESFTVLNTPDRTLFDVDQFPWTGPEARDEFRIIYVGTVAPRYGLDIALRAVKLLHNEVPGIRFVIYPRLDAGEGESLSDLRDLVSRLEMDSLVEFRPPVPLKEMPIVMSRANVGLYTPRVDTHMDIALSVKVPEFVAMMVPVVTTRTKVMERYFSPDQVAFFDDGDVEGCAEAIRRLYGHPSEAREMARRAFRFFQKYPWETESERYLQLLTDLTDENPER